MAKRITYNVKVGHNVPSLKPAPEALLCPLLEFDEAYLQARSRKISWEIPICLLIAGGLIGLITPYVREIEKLRELHDILSLVVTGLTALVAVTLIVWGLGLFGAQKTLRIEDGKIVWIRSFFWIPLKRVYEEMPECILYTARKNPGEAQFYRIDLRLKLPIPKHPWISIFALEGYTTLHEADGAHLLDYERALQETHEKANEIAAALNIEHRPNLSKGPVPTYLRSFYRTDGASQQAPEQIEAETAE